MRARFVKASAGGQTPAVSRLDQARSAFVGGELKLMFGGRPVPIPRISDERQHSMRVTGMRIQFQCFLKSRLSARNSILWCFSGQLYQRKFRLADSQIRRRV